LARQAPPTWVCPNCRRSVPRYIVVCHCGTRKGDADLIRPAGARVVARDRLAGLRGLPWAVWAWFGAFTLVVILTVVRMFMPWQPPRYFPLLGQADHIPVARPHR
jgi:hypothetical protein